MSTGHSNKTISSTSRAPRGSPGLITEPCNFQAPAGIFPAVGNPTAVGSGPVSPAETLGRKSPPAPSFSDTGRLWPPLSRPPERTAPAISPTPGPPTQEPDRLQENFCRDRRGWGLWLGFLFKSWFQFCNIVLLGNGGVSSLIGFSTGGEAEKEIQENAILSMPVHVMTM